MSMLEHLVDRRTSLGLAAAAVASSICPGRVDAYVFTPAMDDAYVPYASRWLISHFGQVFEKYARDTPYSVALFCAIACQESGYAWWRKSFRGTHSPETILQMLVLDDGPDRKLPHLIEAGMEADPSYQKLLPALIQAADHTRVAQGEAFPTLGKLRYGYGLFQYDLDNIRDDPDFWMINRTATAVEPAIPVIGQWGDINVCADRLVRILNRKYEMAHRNLSSTIRFYNGSNDNSMKYRDTVIRFTKIIENDQHIERKLQFE